MENNKSLGRLQRNQDFLDLRNKGRRLRPQPWLILNFRSNQIGQLRLGITASRKVASAVVRNKLKRWSREYARQFIRNNFNPSYDLNVVFLPFKPDFYKRLQSKDYFRELEKVFEKFEPVK